MDPLLLIVLNPHTRSGAGAALWPAALAALRAGAAVEEMETRGDGADADRIAARLAARRFAVVVAAGGDGTVNVVVQALRRASSEVAPALGILPLGTGNNVARSFGLGPIRREGVRPAVAAILDGADRRIDLGQVGDRVFLGSFTVGMDAHILASRNRWRAHFRLGRRAGGYPLYLLACAINLLRHRATGARLGVDGTHEPAAVYNLLITNTALYAGEFRFDAEDHSDDGRLDLRVFTGPADYVRQFVAAWRRHLRHGRGQYIEAAAGLRRVERVAIELDRPVASQLDGEEHGPAARYEVRAIPAALRVRVPSGSLSSQESQESHAAASATRTLQG